MTNSASSALRCLLVASLGVAITACATDGTGEETGQSDAPSMSIGSGTPVRPAAETVAVGTANADAADDPAIWVDAADASRVVLFGTDKKAGLYAYRLDGSVLQQLAGGQPNNVDLREGFVVDGRAQVLVGTSDRSPARFGVALFLMDPVDLQTRYWGRVAVDLTEPYGLCMGKRGDDFIVIVNSTDGQVRQLAISVGADGQPAAAEQKRYAASSQVEGCVIDEKRDYVYLGEEAKGVWRYSLDPALGAERLLVGATDGKALVPDVEGLALMRQGTKTFLMASSQGDSAFAVWRVDGEPAYLGRFSVVPHAGIDSVTGTDGIAALGGPVGSFAHGLVMVQDDLDEAPGVAGERQNFKLVDWREIASALHIED
jgi:3-phytase